MALLQWHKVYKFSEGELYRHPVVALICRYMVVISRGVGRLTRLGSVADRVESAIANVRKGID